VYLHSRYKYRRIFFKEKHMGTAKKRVRPQRMTSLSNECWDFLTEISEGPGDEKMSRSKAIELLAQLGRDLMLDEPTLPLVNKLRAKLGKKPLENKNRSYRDILTGSKKPEK
jgi:hypothetical protein